MVTSSDLTGVEVVLTVPSSDLVEVVRLEGQEEQEAVEVQEVSFSWQSFHEIVVLVVLEEEEGEERQL